MELLTPLEVTERATDRESTDRLVKAVNESLKSPDFYGTVPPSVSLPAGSYDQRSVWYVVARLQRLGWTAKVVGGTTLVVSLA